MIGDPVFSLLRGKYSGRPLLAAPKYLPTWAQPNFHCHCPNLGARNLSNIIKRWVVNKTFVTLQC